ncbi:hypothetical protein Leryth_010457 [Lithospermum erythrorhizon]|nr:hypothetical protein Leryth_010457 [Lithospermum erythrorhizon]
MVYWYYIDLGFGVWFVDCFLDFLVCWYCELDLGLLFGVVWNEMSLVLLNLCESMLLWRKLCISSMWFVLLSF